MEENTQNKIDGEVQQVSQWFQRLGKEVSKETSGDFMGYILPALAFYATGDHKVAFEWNPSTSFPANYAWLFYFSGFTVLQGWKSACSPA